VSKDWEERRERERGKTKGWSDVFVYAKNRFRR
jgi:hypothetical protein